MSNLAWNLSLIQLHLYFSCRKLYSICRKFASSFKFNIATAFVSHFLIQKLCPPTLKVCPSSRSNLVPNFGFQRLESKVFCFKVCSSFTNQTIRRNLSELNLEFRLLDSGNPATEFQCKFRTPDARPKTAPGNVQHHSQLIIIIQSLNSKLIQIIHTEEISLRSLMKPCLLVNVCSPNVSLFVSSRKRVFLRATSSKNFSRFPKFRSIALSTGQPRLIIFVTTLSVLNIGLNRTSKFC